MPRAAPHPCAAPGCGVLLAAGRARCAAHAFDRRRYEAQPGRRAEKQVYGGTAWRKQRRRVLARDGGRCVRAGCGKPAIDVDHIVPRKRGGTDSMDNLESLCRGHHSSKTAGETLREEDGRWSGSTGGGRGRAGQISGTKRQSDMAQPRVRGREIAGAFSRPEKFA